MIENQIRWEKYDTLVMCIRNEDAFMLHKTPCTGETTPKKSRLDLTVILKFILTKHNIGRWRATVNTVLNFCFSQPAGDPPSVSQRTALH